MMGGLEADRPDRCRSVQDGEKSAYGCLEQNGTPWGLLAGI